MSPIWVASAEAPSGTSIGRDTDSMPRELSPVSAPTHRLWRWAAYLLVAAGAVATFLASLSYWALCRDGTHTSCLDGQGPTGELIGQLVAGPVAFALAVLTLVLVARRAYRMAVVGALLAAGAWVVWVELLSSASG